MNTSEPRTLFVGGLWLDPLRFPFGETFPETSRLDRISFANHPYSIDARAQALKSYLDSNRGITQLIGHSAGCLVIKEALFGINRVEDGRINKAVLLNPAPLPGVKMSLTDPLFWMILKYGPRILTGKAVRLTLKEFSRLSVPLSRAQYAQMVSETANILRELIIAQLKRKTPIPQTSTSVITYFAGNGDRMLGSTQPINEALWHGYRDIGLFNRWKRGEIQSPVGKIATTTALYGGREEISGSHFGTIANFDLTLQLLRDRADFEL